MSWRLRLSGKSVRKLAELPIYCQQQKCSPGNVVSGSIRFMQIFVVVRWRAGVKWEWVVENCDFRFFRSLSYEHFTYIATRQLADDTTVNDLGHISRSLDCFTSNFSKTVCDTAKVTIDNRKSYTSFRLVPLLMTLKYFEGHFSLGCHFHVHFCNPRHAFASHGLPAIAELLVTPRALRS